MDLHPALLDFGEPWTYVAALFDANSGSGGSVDGPTSEGVKLTAGTTNGGYATLQMLQTVTPASGKTILVAGRVSISSLTNSNLWFGLWSTDGDPITAFSGDALIIEKDSSAIQGKKVVSGSGSATDDLRTISAASFVDVAVLVLGVATVQFLAKDANGAWIEEVLTTVPATAMRPSVAVQNAGAASSIFTYVRSFFEHEES